jgi:hypothetical protein
MVASRFNHVNKNETKTQSLDSQHKARGVKRLSKTEFFLAT